MNPSRRREINGLARTILDGLELQVPVNLELAVERLGGELRVVEQMERNMEALIRKRDERFVIELAESKPESRKRFSIAHELGHLFLHMGYLLDPDAWDKTGDYKDAVYFRFGYGSEEAEANEFAAAFLMPESEFEVAVKEHTKGGKCSIGNVADRFQTSKDAVVKRGQFLGLF